MKPRAYNHQTLFEFAIIAHSTVISEFGATADRYELFEWAWDYADKKHLDCPLNAEAFGIYWELEPEDLETYPLLRHLLP